MFNQRLKELRLQKKLTQKEVSAIIGISERHYQDYEYGKKEPTLGNFKSLVNFFEVSADYFLQN